MQIITSPLEYQDALKQSSKVIVEFYMDNEPSCQTISSDFKQLSKGYPQIMFLLVNVEYNSAIAGSEKITAVPTFLFYINGKVFTRFTGASKDELVKCIDRLNSAMDWFLLQSIKIIGIIFAYHLAT